MLDFGVNRLSFGAQSFNGAELKTLERHHNPFRGEPDIMCHCVIRGIPQFAGVDPAVAEEGRARQPGHP